MELNKNKDSGPTDANEGLTALNTKWMGVIEVNRGSRDFVGRGSFHYLSFLTSDKPIKLVS